MKEAYLYAKEKTGQVRCFLCQHRCLIKENGRGICGVRENRRGILISLVYEKVIAQHVDPIEKKPLFHFLPGSSSLSIATVGCNFKCRFCQNADISQMPSDLQQIAGAEVTHTAIVAKAQARGCRSISYTYTEPTIFFELALDTARLAASKGLMNVFVSNGYMTEECLNEIYPDLHAANVDLKSFRDEFYRSQCGARLAPVLETLRMMKRLGIWLEVTTLLIPEKNDSPEELRDLTRFIADLDPSTPWHVSRFHPTYRLTDTPPTPPRAIRTAKEIGHEAGLKYVYPGNLPGDEGEKTFCHQCGELLIDRFGFTVRAKRIRDNRCPRCGVDIPGFWEMRTNSTI